MGENVARNM